MRAAEAATAAPEVGDARGARAAAPSAPDHDDDHYDPTAATVPCPSSVPEAAAARRGCHDGRGEAGPAANFKPGIPTSVTHFAP